METLQKAIDDTVYNLTSSSLPDLTALMLNRHLEDLLAMQVEVVGRGVVGGIMPDIPKPSKPIKNTAPKEWS